jgi:hypothetical protein
MGLFEKIENIAAIKATRSTGYLLSKRMETSARERYVLPPHVNLRKIANVESSKSVSSSRPERSEVEGSDFIAGSATNSGAPSYAWRRVGK